VKKALVMLLVVALFCTSLHVTLSESEEIVSEEIVSEAVDAVVEEVDGFFLGDAWPDEAPELPEALPVIAGETPEAAEPVDADLQAGGEALPLSVEGVDAAEEVPGTGEPEAPAEGGTAAGDADTVALPEDGGDGTPAEGAGEAETPAEADAGEGLEGDAEATVAQAEEGLFEAGEQPGEGEDGEDGAGDMADGVPIDADHFPDERLRAYVSDEYDADGDGALCNAERLAVTEFDISKVGRVFSLQGLEHFTAIRRLCLAGLWETSVDVSPFADLEVLDCRDSRLAAIDLKDNPGLRALRVSGSDLTSLDVSRNGQLAELDCAGCLLTSLNIGEGSALESLVCDDNRLTALSLGQTSLRYLSCAGNGLASIDVGRCPMLARCLQDGERASRSGTVSFALSDGHALILDGNCAVVSDGEVLYDPQATLSLEADEIDLGVGEKWTVLSDKSGVRAADCAFTSDDDKVASVSSSGVVKARKKGDAVIRVAAANGQTAALAVHVLGAPKKVTLSAGKLTLGVSERADFMATLPKNTASRLKWTDSNPGIVRYDEAAKALQALKPGKTTLTVKTFNGKKAKCVVTVLEEPHRVRFDAPTLTLGVDESYTLKPAIEPAGALTRLTYSADDEAVAAATNVGEVTALKTGGTTLRARAYNGVEATLELVVKEAPTNLEINTGSRTMGVGETFQLVPTIPEGSASHFTYKSSKTRVATVSADGLITAKRTGKAKITVSTYNKNKVTVTVTVKKKPGSIKLSASAVELGVGQVWSPKVKFSKEAGGGLTWQSSDEAVFTVDDGKVTARAIGEATLDVESYNGKTASCQVTVKAAPTQIRMDEEELTIPVGKKLPLGYTVTAEGYEECADACTFTSSNKKVMTVSASGQLKAVKIGYATITATTWNGLPASVNVKVVCAPKKITLTSPANELSVGEQMTMGYKLSPVLSLTTVTWSSNNPKVAIISADGVVTGINEGTVKITGKTHNGKKATRKLKIIPGTEPVTGVALSMHRITLPEGEPYLLAAQIQPRNARDRSVTWTSSDPSVATVSNGIVKAVGVGEALITAIANGNETCTDVCSVRVTEGAGGDVEIVGEASPDGDFDYVLSDGECIITGYKGPGGSVVVPSMIEGMPVTGIADEAFIDAAGITGLVIPEGVVAIGEKAFARSGLTEITLPFTLTDIARNAFDGCKIGAAHAPWGSKAFDYCRTNGWFNIPWAPELKLATYRGEVFKVVNTPVDPFYFSDLVYNYVCTSPNRTGKYHGRCLGYAYYYTACMMDNVVKVSPNHPYKTSKKCDYTTKKYGSSKKMMAKLYDLLNKGVPQILMVEAVTKKNSRHFVTVIGYRASVTRREDLTPKDLLIIDSFDGKVESMDPEIEKFETRHLYKQHGQYRIEAVTRR